MTLETVTVYKSISWLSEAALKVKNIVGDSLWKKMVDTVGGCTLYIPLESNYYERRNREIRLFARKHSLEKTAQHFCLSDRQTKRILSSSGL